MTLQHIGVLTSGGDSPGMNACIHSFTKAAVSRGIRVSGILRGYAGLLAKETRPLGLADVDGICRYGGTILGSARCPRMMTLEGQAEARAVIAKLGLDGLLVIGGNGSLTGAHVLGADAGGTPGCTIVGVPASIDNDVGGSGLAIGVDTALNTIVEACDRISDTAAAHRRVFIVEVMGRQCGYLAMRSGIAAEADAVLYAENQRSEDEIVERLSGLIRSAFTGARHKRRVLVVKAEGVKVPTATLVDRLQAVVNEEHLDVDVRETILGHVVRGGAPSVTDRVIAQRLGLAGLMQMSKGAHDTMCAWDAPGGMGNPTDDRSIRSIPLTDVLKETQALLDGTSPVASGRVALLARVEGLMAL